MSDARGVLKVPKSFRRSEEGRGVAGVLLAAGESRRMGAPKLLLPIGGKAMVRRVAEALVQGGLDPLVAVLGSEATAVARELEGLPLQTVENPRYREGQASSLRAGIEAVPRECRAVAVALGDMPAVTPALVSTLVSAYRTDGRGIVLPVYAGRRGHPVLFDLAKYRAELVSLSGDEGGRSLLARHPEDVLQVTVDDPGAVLDVDTPEAYEKVQCGYTRASPT